MVRHRILAIVVRSTTSRSLVVCLLLLTCKRVSKRLPPLHPPRIRWSASISSAFLLRQRPRCTALCACRFEQAQW